ncbi:hypothetical protein QE152_g7287 [Popillia japonica]|uniref:Uncharacterized protein n=1 Tax=Popillia japonica TaxID=7064 RepID=A0AAW1MBI7_POPJA
MRTFDDSEDFSVEKCIEEFEDNAELTDCNEDSMRTFDGSEDFSVEKWIKEFEDNAELTDCNDLAKYIFAKKSLRRLAKLYIQGEAGLNSWRSLKRALLKEFSTKINSVKLHETLRTRQIKTSLQRNVY